MSADTSCELPARMASLPEAMAFIDAFCAQQAIDPRDALRLNLIVEELLTNTVKHGHRGDSAAPVCIELKADPQTVYLVYADSAPAFDPLAWQTANGGTADGDLDQRPVGQLGIRLIVQMAAQASYQRHDDWNRVRLVLARQC